MDKVILCAIAKCENKYILEWVVWHLKLGFDKIIIYDNNDTDGEYISDVVGNIKKVEIIDWRGKVQGSCETQVAAYNDCYKKHMDSEWIMYLDIDEFLEFRNNIDIKKFLDYTWVENANVIKFHWKCYSDNGYIYEQNGLVTETYKELCANRNTNVNTKSIYRCGIEDFKMLNIHFSNLKEKVYYQSGRPCLSSYSTTDNNINYDNGCVRHYVTKSMQEFVNIKYARRNPGTSKQRLNPSFYFKYNKKTEEKEHKLVEMFEELKNKKDNKITEKEKIGKTKELLQKDLDELNGVKTENSAVLWQERMVPRKKPSVYDLQRNDKKLEDEVKNEAKPLFGNPDLVKQEKYENAVEVLNVDENEETSFFHNEDAKIDDEPKFDIIKKKENSDYQFGISVIISAYNAEKYIEECLDSVINQTWFKTHDNWEILLGVDACEKTLQKVREIMSNYKHLTVYMMDKNVGTYVTCNTIIQNSKYEWLLRFDSDDIMYENMVETLMEKYTDYDYVSTRCHELPNKGGIKHWAEGQMFFKHRIYDEYGGYQNWKCAGDTELRVRTKGHVKQTSTENALLYRRPHENRLTKNKDTVEGSVYRNERKEYIKNISPYIEKIDTVVTTYTIISNIIVSFTTWKKRHDCAAIMLDYFKKQTVKPNKIVCWLSSDEYEGENIPQSLKPFVKEKFIEVRWVKENVYCHKRYEIFKEHKNDYVFLIDDDIYYNLNYIEEMYNAAIEHKDCVICYCGNAFEFEKERLLLDLDENPSIKNTILSGLTCYPPGVFPMEYFKHLDIRDTIAPKCDDSYMQTLCIKNNIGVYCLYNRNKKKFKVVKEYQDVGIWEENKVKINGINKKTKIVKKLMYMFDLEEKCRELWPNIIF